MGSSARKKKEKKKDFQKPKLKVGQAKPKASNFTDTSFKSKAIVVRQQTLDVAGLSPAEQVRHNLALVTTAKSDTQRHDALVYLTEQLSAKPPAIRINTHELLEKVLPTITSQSASVRSQMLKLLRAIPAKKLQHVMERPLMYIRVGMTHISRDIRHDSLDVLEWVLDTAPLNAVSCPGGWVKTLNAFGAVLAWKADPVASPGAANAAGSAAKASGWTSGWTTAPSEVKAPQTRARQIQLLAKFLEVGLAPEVVQPSHPRDYWDNLYRVPQTPNPFAHLNLFGPPRDEESEMYQNQESRQRVFNKRWYGAVKKGVEGAKREGGAIGRVAAKLDQVLKDGMADYRHIPGL